MRALTGEGHRDWVGTGVLGLSPSAGGWVTWQLLGGAGGAGMWPVVYLDDTWELNTAWLVRMDIPVRMLQTVSRAQGRAEQGRTERVQKNNEELWAL